MKELLETGIATDLGYSGKCDALVGKVKELSVVIKENNVTKSYGVLIWVKKKNSTSDDELYAYLSEQVAAKPHIIKHFKTTGRGAALALVKYNDPVRNINNINRFLGDLADDLYAHDYVNCCYACGGTEDLAIYKDGGAVVQYCRACARGTRVEVGDLPEENVADVPEEVSAPEAMSADESELFSAMAGAAADISGVGAAQTMEDLLAAPETFTSDAQPENDAEVISTSDDNADLSDFIMEEAQPETAPEAALEEPVQEEKSAEVSDFGDFIMEETQPDNAPEAAFEEPVQEEKPAGTDGALDALLLSGEEAAETAPEAALEEPVQEEKSAEVSDFGDFIMEETQPETAPEAALEEPVQEEKSAGTDGALDALLLSGEEATETAPKTTGEQSFGEQSFGEPSFGDANTYIEEESGSAEDESPDLDSIMSELDALSDGDSDELYDEEGVENANIYGLMVGSEQEIAEAGDSEVRVLETTAVGKGQDLQVTMQEEEDFGESSEIQVTEIVDDSNEGEDIQIEALSSDFNMPTDTKGGEIVANETPLEEDGSVPMVNPSSDYADVKPSPVRDKNAVRAFAYGSYENANTAAEPVRFDGRPVGYKGTDPRLGDEMGSVSRDYARQNAARTAPGAKPLRSTGYRVVSKADPARNKPIDTSRRTAYSGGSNPVIGTLAALLIGVIGCALWCGLGYVLGLMGMLDNGARSIVMAVLGFLPTVAAFLGYRIGGDCWDIKGIVIAGVISVVMDVVGTIAVFVAGEMQARAAELGYGIPLDKAFENVSNMFSGASAGDALLQLFITIGVMIVTLVAAVFISKKKI